MIYLQYLQFSINAVFPLLVMMSIGFLFQKIGWISSNTTKEINACIFKLFLPLLIFFDIANTDIAQMPDLFVVAYAVIAALVIFSLLFWLVPRFVKQRSAVGVIIQGIGRSNYAIFGIPLVLGMYPDQNTSIAIILVVAVVPVFNICSTIALMAYGTERKSVWSIVKGILLNPLIISTLLGFLFLLMHWKLPSLLASPLYSLSRISTPLALFSLGAGLHFETAKANIRLLTIGVIGRLIVVPFFGLTIAILLGIRGVPLAALVAMFASPTAVSSCPMAQQLGGDVSLAGAQVVFTTFFSVLTVFTWILLLRTLAFL